MLDTKAKKYLQDVQEKLCFFQNLCNPSLAITIFNEHPVYENILSLVLASKHSPLIRSEVIVQHVSMALRSDTRWQLGQPLSGMGAR